MRIKIIENIKNKIQELLEGKASFPPKKVPGNIRKEYEEFISRLENKTIDLHDPNVQTIYGQGCNFLALQSFKMSMAALCGNDPLEIEDKTNEILKLFFSNVRSTLFRSLEINELMQDNKTINATVGPELMDRLNKCNTQKMSEAISMAENLIRQSLRIDENIE